MDFELQRWKDKNADAKGYAHFDARVSLDKIWNIISDPVKVTSHGFYPFIHFTKKSTKYNQVSGPKHKKRELFYSAHIDRYIYSYYGHLLNQMYNRLLEDRNLSTTAIAYRTNLKKTNIDFAKQAFDFIQEHSPCIIIVGDFKNFFDKIDHRYLKLMLKKLLNVCSLPDDYYAVYKNITRFSYWELDDLLSINGLKNNRELNKKVKVLTRVQFRKYEKNSIKTNAENRGIPQGSPISAVLSNIFMIDFDTMVRDFVKEFEGLYLRYSDDFIVVLPREGESLICETIEKIKNFVQLVPGLELQDDKTHSFIYNDGKINRTKNANIDDVNNQKSDVIDYLGFTFDGQIVGIREKTNFKYHNKMYRGSKAVNYCRYREKYDYAKRKRKFYERFTVKGSANERGNYLTYVKRCERVFGDDQNINAGTKRHMKKAKNILY